MTQRPRLPWIRRLVAFAASATLLACVTGASTAQAAPPSLAIVSPSSGSATNDPTPTIAGEAVPGEEEPIVVAVYNAGGELVAQTEAEPLPSWFVTLPNELPEGTYTVQASEQRNNREGTELHSQRVTFTEDRTAPDVAIAAPGAGSALTGGSVDVSGTGGTAAGDQPNVTIEVYQGSGTEGARLEALELQEGPGGAWSGTVAGLSPGSYTLQAVQSDGAGNVGHSAPVAFTMLPLPPASPPKASFTWFPTRPQVGEEITFVSSATDASSPLTGFAWSLGASGSFQAGGPTFETKFLTAGLHVVRMQVRDAHGQSSVAAETILVHHAAASLIQPFPIVRIAGHETQTGVRLSLLTVTAPVSSRVTVRLRQKGQRPDSLSRVATAGPHGSPSTIAVLSFRRFARALPAGAVLEVRVTKSGQIGKLTRFVPRIGRLPTRTDACLSVSGATMRCPVS